VKFNLEMQDPEIILNPNQLVRFLKKPSTEFTRDDIVSFIEENGIEMLNFRYVAEDGKLKTLNFAISGKEYLETILTQGERVDGSSLFSFVEAGSSDLYVIPRYRTAFVNPFSEVPALDILCSFYNSTGEPLESDPGYILLKAHSHFRRTTGYRLKALGELEYYVNSTRDDFFMPTDQKGYHASEPYAKFEKLRSQALLMIAKAGGRTKYGHAEVGSFTRGNELFEQHEIEFLPCDVEDAADQIVVAKWILRMLAYRHGVEISFAPKITVGKAGSGMHVHAMLEKDGVNIMTENGKLSDTARKMIAGWLDCAAALSAFGNTIPTSYLRLVPHQEAPTNICWGDRNRSVLVRVPLGWLGENQMINYANPGVSLDTSKYKGKQTVEFRSPDGSADIYLLLSGLVAAARHGFEMDNALEMADDLYVDVNIFRKEHSDKLKRLDRLPDSCWESAGALEQKRKIFEKDDVFPAGVVQNVIDRLRAYDDKNLSERLYGNNEAIRELVIRHIHCM
jgi:glutamine synthetase